MDNKIKIMLTDGNEDARDMLRDALEQTERFIVIASTGNGGEVLRLVEENRPDLLVLDLLLPGLDGLSILRQMKKENRPQILVTSNFVNQETAAEAGMLGASMFLSKPYNETAMIDHLLRLAEKAEAPARGPGPPPFPPGAEDGQSWPSHCRVC